MDRRRFLQNSSLALGATMLPAFNLKATSVSSLNLNSWGDVRAQFQLSKDRIHMAQMFLASHPLPVQQEIERHRKNFDENPVTYWEEHGFTAEGVVQKAAAAYMKTEPEEIALTDSTTMGLSLLYNGLRLKPGDEILSSTHDHYATDKSLDYAAEKNGATIRRITLYKDSASVTVDEVVAAVTGGIRPATRVVALTWVHSVTGVKLPIKAIADAIAKANGQRDAATRIIFCVDGVHGFGVENASMADLGCDFFVAGTHKWIFGPRGTGVLFGKKELSDRVIPTIPAFSLNAYGGWLGQVSVKPNFADAVTPGGFHSFEHRWALGTAFEFQMKIGKAAVEQRTHQLSTLLKKGLKEIKHVKLHTPISEQLSAGINCFDVEGMKPDDVIKKLHEKHIIGSAAPYKISSARLTPSIVNSEEEVMTCIKAIENIKA